MRESSGIRPTSATSRPPALSWMRSARRASFTWRAPSAGGEIATSFSRLCATTSCRPCICCSRRRSSASTARFSRVRWRSPMPGEAPASPYAAAKAAATLYARSSGALRDAGRHGADLHGLRPGAARPREGRPRVDPRGLEGDPPSLASGARPVDWIHVDDVARGSCARRGARHRRGTLDLGSGELVTVREIVERICASSRRAAAGDRRLADRPLERVRRADAAGTHRRRSAGRPRVGLDEGLAARSPVPRASAPGRV